MKVTCQHCGIKFAEAFNDSPGYLVSHESVCATKSPEQRAFYASRRRWPRPGETLRPPEVRAAKTSAQRTQEWKDRKAAKFRAALTNPST